MERGKEGSDRAHLSENRFKAEKALEAAAAAEQKLAELTPKILTVAEVEKLSGKKTLSGNALKNLSYTEYLSLKQTAAHVEKMEQLAMRDRAAVEVAAEKTPDRLLLQCNKELSEKNKQLERVIRSTKSVLLGVLPELEKTLAPEKLERVNEIISIAKAIDRSLDRGH